MTLSPAAMLDRQIAELREERAAALRDGAHALEVAMVDMRLRKLQRDRQRLIDGEQS